jgi:hypothetical protein
MKFSIVSTLSIAMLALTFSGCTATVTTNTNTPAIKNTNTANSNAPANKPAETDKPATNTSSDAATGDVIKIDEAGIMMTVPKGFKFSKDGEDTVVKTDDEGVDIRFTVPKDGDYEKTITDAATEVDDYLKDVKVEDKGSKITVDGMEGTSLSGTATNEGEPVVWDLTIINAPKKPVLVNIYAEKSSMEKHGADVKKFLESIKKQ